DRERIWLVDDIRFREHPDCPDPTDSKAGFEWLNMPENALRVAEVTIQRNVDALTGLRFVDTPGTDSFILHHQTLATGYIEQYASSPIIYLFDASGAGSETDAANIAFLKTLKGDNARLFFVINKRSILNNEKEEREVIAQVQLRLRDAGLKAKRLYFVDARSALTDRSDEEWIALEDDLRTFIAGNRTDLLRGLIRSRFCNALESRLGDFHKQVETLQSGVEERAARAAQWRETARAIKKVLRQFADAASELKDELFDSASSDFTGDVSDIDDDLASFDCGAVLPGTKSRKMQELVDTVDRLDRWPKRLKDNLASASRHLHAFLRNELASQAEGAEARVDPAQMSPDFVPLTLTDIRAKAREDIVRGGGKWNLFASFRPAMESKVARLREMVKSEKTAAVRRVRTEFEKIVTSYSDQVAPYATRAEGFAKQAEGSGDTASSIQALEASMQLLEKHLREFNGILQ
ncbi:MAG TPA: hypothetical protein VN181_03245, partial [Thermoanaerobaculia bacterium]|nr:hypothetical protein [Thermoanaerobaculia bacterium]